MYAESKKSFNTLTKCNRYFPYEYSDSLLVLSNSEVNVRNDFHISHVYFSRWRLHLISFTLY